MRRKLLAGVTAVALAALAACSPGATAQPYEPSDGIRIEISDEIVAHNVMILSAAEGEPGYLVAGLTNYTKTDTSVELTVGDEIVSLEVPALETVLLRPEEPAEDGVDNLISAVPGAPGTNVEVRMVSPVFGSTSRMIPVLDGTLSPYDQYLP